MLAQEVPIGCQNKLKKPKPSHNMMGFLKEYCSILFSFSFGLNESLNFTIEDLFTPVIVGKLKLAQSAFVLRCCRVVSFGRNGSTSLIIDDLITAIKECFKIVKIL